MSNLIIVPSQPTLLIDRPIGKFIIGIEEIAKCSGKKVAFDTETTGLLWCKDKMIGVGLHCPEAGVSGYIPTLNDYDRKAVIDEIKKWAKGTVVVCHNLKFDFHAVGISPRECGWHLVDTTILAHIVDSRLRKALTNLEFIYLGETSKRGHIDEAPRGKKNKIWEWPLSLTSAYCMNDCIVTYQLAAILVPQVVELGLWDLYLKDINYLMEIWDTERYGIRTDLLYISDSIAKLNVRLEGLEEELYDSIGYEFNWRSPQQLSRAIYQDLGIEKPKNPFADADGVDRSRFADAGKYKSTCTSTFILTEKIHHPLGTLIFALRETDKLLRNYLTRWFDMVDDNDDIHASFNITGTRTGRLSCSKPNLQNIPAEARGRFTQSVYTGSTERSDEYNLRLAFVARPGKTWVSIDYKQMEMRMFGILSQDPFMLNSLRAGRDVHGDIAEKVWGSRDKVHREWSKTISFGLIYGMTIGSLMYKLNMTRSEAARVCDEYWAEFPRIKPWLDEVVDKCMRFGYIRYWSGRIWREEYDRDMYKGANALIQGGCADLLSIAALRVGKWCREQGSEFHLVNYVHDELILEVPTSEVLRTAQSVGEIMRVPDLLGIPFITDAKAGQSYGSFHELDIKLDDSAPQPKLEPPKEPDNPFTEEDVEDLGLSDVVEE